MSLGPYKHKFTALWALYKNTPSSFEAFEVIPPYISFKPPPPWIYTLMKVLFHTNQYVNHPKKLLCCYCIRRHRTTDKSDSTKVVGSNMCEYVPREVGKFCTRTNEEDMVQI